jgi:hypothetical protein
VTGDVTVVYVAYGVDAIDLDWIPAGIPVIVVHNDDRLDRAVRPGLTHVEAGANIGFGAGVNLALQTVHTQRVVICNPDLTVTPAHFASLASGSPDEIVTLPVVDNDGGPTPTVTRYPTPAAHVLTALRVGRWFPLHSRARRLLSPLLGGWGRDHAASLGAWSGVYPLATHWPSGAVLSIDTERLRAVGGFDAGYFLYLEDTDLAARLAARWPDMRIRLVGDVPPARHAVGGSQRTASDRAVVARARWASARRFASSRTGWRWRLASAALAVRGPR